MSTKNDDIEFQIQIKLKGERTWKKQYSFNTLEESFKYLMTNYDVDISTESINNAEDLEDLESLYIFGKEIRIVEIITNDINLNILDNHFQIKKEIQQALDVKNITCDFVSQVIFCC